MSWIGNQVSNLGGALNLPEFGISESINSIGQQPTNWNTNTPLNNYVQSNPGTVNTGNIGQVLGTSMLAPGNAAGIAEFNANQTSTGGSSSGGGSTGGGGGSSAPDLSNPSKQTDYARSLGYDTWDQMVNAQNEVKNRESQIRNTINSGYDQYSNRLNEMLPFFQGQQTDQLGALDNSYQTIQQGLDQGYQSGIDKLGIARKQVGSTVANSVEDIKNNLSQAMRASGMQLGAWGAGDTSASEVMAPYAYTKMAGQEYGKVQRQGNDQYFQIQQQELETKNRYESMVNQTNLQKQEQIASIKQQYGDRLAQVRAELANAPRDQAMALANMETGLLQAAQSKLAGIEEWSRNTVTQQQQWAQNRLSQLNDAKLDMSNSSNFSPQDIMYNELSAINGDPRVGYGQSTFMNPMLLKQRKDELGY